MTDAARRLLRRDGGALRVKVCCIVSSNEADIAIVAGAAAIGLVSAMPSGPGPIPESDIAGIVRHVGNRAATVLLTSRQEARAIGEQLDRVRPDVVQLVDELHERDYEQLRGVHPDVALMQVLHVYDEGTVREAARVAPFVDALLLDSGNPRAAVKELGGTGRVHDWRVSLAVREAVGVPVFLAGGLRAANVAGAVATVRPFGVDVCSGVRTNGRLDVGEVQAFVHAARAAHERGNASIYRA